jgi:signal transduction histidine kinase
VVETTSFASQALFLVVALYMAWTALKSPRRSNYFALAFFMLFGLIISITWLQPLIEPVAGETGSTIAAVLVLLLPYVQLRLAEEFSSIHRFARRICETALVASVILAIYPGPGSFPVLVLLLTYFVTVTVYSSTRFTLAANTANGISRMRFRALSYASVLLGLALFSVAITAVVSGWLNDGIAISRQLMLMVSALMYFAGFTPPVMLKRAWQEPELRRFLYETRQIPQQANIDNAIKDLERITAETVGAPFAAIGLWNEATETIDFPMASLSPGQTIGGKAFAENRSILSLDAPGDDPESRELYEYGDARAVMAAPINTDRGKIGVVALYTPNPPIFAEDDIVLLEILADQIGILLENRRHIEAQAELSAREASTRLKDEFLSVAAHDLKTPLTTILATGQYLERRISAQGEGTAEFRSIVRLNREAVRLRRLVEGLLDASRIEQGQLVTTIERNDVSELIQDAIDRAMTYHTHEFELNVPPAVVADCDASRILQVAENLIENARKYSPGGSTITITLSETDDSVSLFVRDQGIGIGTEDQKKVFDRYFRTQDAEYQTAQGIGLGLYICKAIIEQHGGQISVDSTPGDGSTFCFTIPKSSRLSTEESNLDSLANSATLQEH